MEQDNGKTKNSSPLQSYLSNFLARCMRNPEKGTGPLVAFDDVL